MSTGNEDTSTLVAVPTSTSSKNKVTKSLQHADSVLNKLNTFYKQREFFDIVLIAAKDRTEVYAHRVVLSASSDFFLTMFRSDLKEARTNEIELKDIDGETLRSIVDFMYTAEIELNSETIESTVSAAGYYRMDTLIACCCDFMANELDASNCLGISSFADKHGYIELKTKSFEYAEKNFESVCAEKEFLQLTDDQLVQFLSSDNLGVSSEEIVFRCIVDWFRFDSENRENSMFNLLNHIRAAYLTAKFITEHRFLVCKKSDCSDMISRWLDWHSSPHCTLLKVDQNRPRKAYNILAFATGYDSNTFSVHVYDRARNRWSERALPSPPIKRENYKAIQIGESLIIAGGEVYDLLTSRVEYLDLQTLKWNELPPMPQARWNFAMAELHGCLYIIGGYDGKKWLQTVFKYDFASREWEEVKPLPSIFVYVQVCVLNGLMYAAGDFSSIMALYDPTSDEWITKAFKRERSKAFSMAALRGHLYTVGGYLEGIESPCVERYDPAYDSWTELKPLPEGRDGIKCAVLNNRLIACGGDNSECYVNSVEEYNPETNNWQSLAPMLSYINDPLCNLFTLRGGTF